MKKTSILDRNKKFIIKEYKNGVSILFLSKKFGCHRTTLVNRLKKWKIYIKGKRCVPKIDKYKKDIIKYYNKNYNCTTISRIFNCSPGPIRRILKELGLNTSKNYFESKSGFQSSGWKGMGELSGDFWNKIVRGAKLRKLSIEIDIENAYDIFIKQNRKCALSGKELKFKSKTRISDGNASLDRIDSSKGYIKGNIQWVDKQVNICKQDLSDKDFIALCNAISKFNKNNGEKSR